LDNLKEEEEEDGAIGDSDAHREGKAVVIKTSTRQVLPERTLLRFSFNVVI